MIKFFSKRSMSLTVLFSLALTAGAQLTDGKVYQFKNREHGQKAMGANSPSSIRVVTPDTSDHTQLWIAEAGTDANAGQFALRNLSTGLYLRNPESTSAHWKMVTKAGGLDGNCYNYCVQRTDGNFYTMAPNAQGTTHNCMHADGGGSIVCWTFDGTATQWTINEVPTITQEFIQSQIQKWDGVINEQNNLTTYEAALNLIFADKACTKLSTTYAAKTVEQIQADAEYLKLSPTLQQMVIKVKTGNWAENNADATKQAQNLNWSSEYAKQFRVQLIEPYCDPHEAARALHINPHSHMNNPTGIYSQANQVLYVMVEGTIAPGAELYIGNFSGHGKPESSHRSGTQLREGLNIVPYYADESATHIDYIVETFKDGRKTDKRLSQFKDLKVHIEGGYINGYFNAMGDSLYPADDDTDWTYYEQRANLKDFTILGKYQAIHFFLNEVKDDGGNLRHGLSHFLPEQVSVQKMIAAWDRVMMSERLTLGLLSKAEIEEANRRYPSLDDPKRGIYAYMGEDQDLPIDYSDHYRLHGLSYSALSGHMYGAGDHSGYNVACMPEILVNIASDKMNEGGSAWGPGHEIGHQHQAGFNMNGLTEVTNNLFSNIALWYDGRSTSRVNGQEGALQKVQEVFNRPGTDFFHNNIWAQTHMYYKLWLYYHLAGHNNKFYPRLLEMLRQDPMKISGNQQGATSLLHFYKMCCKAAKEDLTDFFRAYGFFTPMNNRLVNDYYNAHYTQTQEEIDAAIAEVKKLGYPVNHGALFINDCAGKPSLSHDGKTQRVVFDQHNNQPMVNADLGMYTDYYTTKLATPSGDTQCTINGNTMTISGDLGGVGILLYDAQGNLVGFSDRKTFPLNETQQAAFARGELNVQMTDATGKVITLPVTNPTEAQQTILAEEIKRAEAIIALKDDTKTIVGRYHGEALVGLNKALTEARTASAGTDLQAKTVAFQKLHEEMQKLETMPNTKTLFVPGSTYRVMVKGNSKYLKRNDGNTNVNLGVTDKAQADAWLFQASNVADAYYLKNVRTNEYIQQLSNNTNATVTTDSTKAGKFLLKPNEGHYFLLTSKAGDNNTSLNYNTSGNKVLGWNGVDNYSRWQLELVTVNQALAARSALETMVDAAQQLLRTSQKLVTVALQTTNASAPNHLFCNAPYLQHSYGDYSPADKGYNLLDNNDDTHLHTDYSGGNSTDGLDHYLRVDFGSSDKTRNVFMNLVTRNNNGNENPKTIKVETSADNQTYTLLTTLNNIPRGVKAQYTSPALAAKDRYIRFMVTETYGNNKTGPADSKHPYFSLATFGIKTVDSYALQMINDIDAAQQSLSNQQTPSADLQAAETKLKASYEMLLARLALEEQIEVTNDLVGRMTDTLAIKMQTADQNAANHLYCNAPHKSGGDNSPVETGYNLLDDNLENFLHTDYSGANSADGLDHYLRVDFGTPHPKGFRMKYVTRKNGGGEERPETILVQTSQDNKTYATIDTLTNLPRSHNAAYTSPVYQTDARYVRFMVTKNQYNKQAGGHAFFSMNAFDIETVETLDSYTDANTALEQVVKDNIAANTALNNTQATKADIETATATLQASYSDLVAQRNLLAKNYDLTVSKYGYASFCLDRNLQMPQGVTAYTVRQTLTDHVKLAPIANGVVPARTPVIVKAQPGQYRLTYVANDKLQPLADNLLQGTINEKVIKGEAGHSYYLFGARRGVVALYKAWLEYRVDGSQTPEINNTDNGGYFRVPANKVWLPIADGAAYAAGLTFVLDEVQTSVLTPTPQAPQQPQRIYDLQGRRVQRIQQPGIYIVNGKKVYVRAI